MGTWRLVRVEGRPSPTLAKAARPGAVMRLARRGLGIEAPGGATARLHFEVGLKTGPKGEVLLLSPSGQTFRLLNDATGGIVLEEERVVRKGRKIERLRARLYFTPAS